MKTLTTLLLTLGLCALSLPAFAGPSCDANADESLNVLDVVAIVGAVLGTSEAEVNCAGPGCDVAVADATSGMFTQAQMDAAVADATSGMYTQAQMDEAVAAATPDPAPNCLLMGLCGLDGVASYGIPGPYSQMSSDDAMFEGSLCLEAFWVGVGVSDLHPELDACN